MVATIAIALALMVMAGASPVAVDGIGGDSITPDNPLYVMERVGENMMLTVGAEKHLNLANERLDELEQMVQVRTRTREEIQNMINYADNSFRNAGTFDTGEIKVQEMAENRIATLSRIRSNIESDKVSIIDDALNTQIHAEVTAMINERINNKENVNMGG